MSISIYFVAVYVIARTELGFVILCCMGTYSVAGTEYRIAIPEPECQVQVHDLRKAQWTQSENWGSRAASQKYYILAPDLSISCT